MGFGKSWLRFTDRFLDIGGPKKMEGAQKKWACFFQKKTFQGSDVIFSLSPQIRRCGDEYVSRDTKRVWYLRRSFFLFWMYFNVTGAPAWLGDEGRRELPATQTSEAGCTTLTCLAPTMPCCAVKIRCTTVLSRPRTDLQRAEQAQDNRPLNLARDVACAKDRVLACRLRKKDSACDAE